MKMYYKDKLISILEDVIVVIVMFGIFLPVRVVFYNTVSSNWFGSFGLISIIVVTLVYLSYKNKLGFFGRAYWRTITKVHKGKRRILSYFLIGFSLYLWCSIIIGVNFAQTDQEAIELSNQIKNTMTPEEIQKINDLEQAIKSGDIQQTNNQLMDGYTSVSPEILLLMAFALIILPVVNFLNWAVLVNLLDTWLNGWLLHFGTVFFIEMLEVVGIMIFTYRITKKGNITVNKP